VTSERSLDPIKPVRGLLVPHHGNAAVEDFEERAKDVPGD
jgi:hypothetical protein